MAYALKPRATDSRIAGVDCTSMHVNVEAIVEMEHARYRRDLRRELRLRPQTCRHRARKASRCLATDFAGVSWAGGVTGVRDGGRVQQKKAKRAENRGASC